MTLLELSREYEHSAQLLRIRLQQLRRMEQSAANEEEAWQLRYRISVLTPILTQMNELAELTAHYYEKGYYRNEKYTL